MSEVFDEKAVGEEFNRMFSTHIPERISMWTAAEHLARWQFEQDKAAIADLKSQLEAKGRELEMVKAIAIEIISKDPAYHCYRDLQKAKLILSELLGEQNE